MSRQRFLDLLEGFSSHRVGVVGDFLLDQYMLGTTSRVSREAPIVVVDYQDTVYHPGGAANAAQNVTAFGAMADAVGVRGDDREGGTLAALLAGRGVNTGGLLCEPAAATSTKLRILAGEMNAQKQQVARVDRAHRLRSDDGLRRRLFAAAETAIEAADVLLFADYGLGVLGTGMIEHAMARARLRGIPTVVDSRHRLREFRGATVATPNEVEAMEALALASEAELTAPDVLGERVAASGLANLIVTRGSKGMVVCGRDARFESIGIAGSREATDVTGAGDTVSAVVALSLAAGARLNEAARMATYAASVVVMKRGTATASPDEVRRAIAAGDSDEGAGAR